MTAVKVVQGPHSSALFLFRCCSRGTGVLYWCLVRGILATNLIRLTFGTGKPLAPQMNVNDTVSMPANRPVSYDDMSSNLYFMTLWLVSRRPPLLLFLFLCSLLCVYMLCISQHFINELCCSRNIKR